MIGYYLAIGLGNLLSRLPYQALYTFSNFLRFLMMRVIAYRKEVIQDNLRRSFPEKKTEELENIRQKFYANFADIIVESLKSLNLSEKDMRRRVKLNKPEVFQRLYNKEKGVIMVMGHYTNFEWIATAIPLLVPQKCFAVYHPLNNKRFSRKIVQIREQFGLTLFPMEETYPFMLNNPEKNPLYVFMADQSPHKGKIKYRTQFLNQSTPVHLGVENLAKKCGLAVVFINIQRVKRGHYEITPELLFEDGRNTEQYEITDTHVKALEKVIIKKPSDWLWSHRRWKYV